MDAVQKYLKGQKAYQLGNYALTLGALIVGVGVFVTIYGHIVDEYLGDVVSDLLILGGFFTISGLGGIIYGESLRSRYAPKITGPIEAIKTLHMSAPKADIPWDACEEESFEIVKALIQKGHSGMDIMFMGTRLEYYGLVAAHHEREEEMLRWAVTGSPEELAMTNDILKGYEYALVKREESEG